MIHCCKKRPKELNENRVSLEACVFIKDDSLCKIQKGKNIVLTSLVSKLEMKLKWLFIDSLYLPSVCNLSPNSMIYHLLATASLLGGQPFTKKNLYHFLRYCRPGHAKMFNRWILDQRGRYRGSRSFLDQLYGLFHGRCSESY